MSSGGELLVRGLAAHAVDTVFGIPGTHNLEIYRHLSGYGIRHITVRHEQGAGYAADGFARTSGRPGVALVTSGPAVLNITAAVGQAYSDSVPLLVLAPGPPTSHAAGSGTLHEMRDQRGAMAAVAKAAYRVASHEELAEVVSRSFVDMTWGRPGPVYLEVPTDLLAAEAELDPRPIPQPAAIDADRRQLTEAGGLLSNARRPLLLLGGGARWAGAQALRLAGALDAPILTTVNGKGAVPEDHRFSLGAALHLDAARRIVAESDVLLAVGTEFAETDWWNGLPEPGKLVRVDVDPGQIARNLRPDVALHGEAARVLEQLATRVERRLEHGGEHLARWRAMLREEAAQEGARWLPVLATLRDGLARDAVVVTDTAMACYYGAVGNLPVYQPGGFCHPTGFATLGYAVPAALGAKVAHPAREVVALVGDGGLMFSVQELAAIAAEALPLPVVVFANGGYGEIRSQMRAAGIAPVGVDLPEPDFVALARALGGHGAPFTEDALAEALVRPAPSVLVVAKA